MHTDFGVNDLVAGCERDAGIGVNRLPDLLCTDCPVDVNGEPINNKTGPKP